jgi:hypothetical protein
LDLQSRFWDSNPDQPNFRGMNSTVANCVT